jgi:hypothetical protein
LSLQLKNSRESERGSLGGDLFTEATTLSALWERLHAGQRYDFALITLNNVIAFYFSFFGEAPFFNSLRKRKKRKKKKGN